MTNGALNQMELHHLLFPFADPHQCVFCQAHMCFLACGLNHYTACNWLI
jgi:hypothetical protein